MEDLQTLAHQMGVNLTSHHLAQFETYYQLLADWNKQVNLTRIIDKNEVITKHFLDSLSCLPSISPLPTKIIDVGSGAGFPGIPLKIVQPECHMTLVEATGKKVKFLEAIVSTLKLQNVTVLHHRAEEVGRQAAHRRQYGLALARAVARLNVLVEYLLPLLKQNGLMLVQKGQDPIQEVIEAKNALGILGGLHLKTIPVTVPNLEAERHLILIKKVKVTPAQYPRKAGTPAKKPIK